MLSLLFYLAIFHAAFDSCSSFFAPKLHRNACYAGYNCAGFSRLNIDFLTSIKFFKSLPVVVLNSTVSSKKPSCMSIIQSCLASKSTFSLPLSLLEIKNNNNNNYLLMNLFKILVNLLSKQM